MLTPNAADSLDKPQFISSYQLPLNETGGEAKYRKTERGFRKETIKKNRFQEPAGDKDGYSSA